MFGYLKRVFKEFGQDKAGQMSAAFSYIAVFSVAPLLLVLISVAGFFFGQKAVEGQLFSQLSSVMGPEAAKSLQNVIAHSHSSGSGTVALVVGLVGSLLGAIALSSQLQNSFNTVFDAVPDPKGGIKRTIYTKLKNVSLVIVGGLAVAASVATSAIVSALGHKAKDKLGVPAIGVELIDIVASLIIFVTILYLLYRVLPDVRIPRKIVLWAAFWVSVLFLIGKIILGVVIGRNGTAGAYGAAASVIVLMLWFYYTAQILILGAEGIKVYAQGRGIEFEPKRYTLKRKSLNMDSKYDLRGRLLEAFAKGYNSKKQK